MLSEAFSHGLIRDFVVAFGTLFNNIKINRRAASGETEDTIAIPLSYAPQQRYLERITQDLNLDRPVAMSLPRMSFEIISMNYSSERKLNTMQRYYGKRTDASNTEISSSYAPVPYDFNFQLSVFITNIEDGTHIVEQILPYFTPEFTLSLKSVTELGVALDLPVVLNSVNMEDSYEGGFDERRIIIWTLDFTLKGHLFGPVANYGLINKAIVNFHTSSNTAIANNYEQMVSQPAMFANGSSTNSAALSVQFNLIASNSDYGISQEIYGIDEDPNTFKLWDFEQGSHQQTVSFGPWAGNTSYDGWESFEAGLTANGDVVLSRPHSFLRHTISKTAPLLGTSAYSEDAQLRIYANSTPKDTFSQFYGKNYQNVSMRFRIKDTNSTGDSVFTWKGQLRWLTTDSLEKEWSSGTTNRYIESGTPSDYTTSDFDVLSQNFQTINFDLSGRDDWNDRIITGLWIDLFNAGDNNSEMVIETDIDYIKISANTG